MKIIYTKPNPIMPAHIVSHTTDVPSVHELGADRAADIRRWLFIKLFLEQRRMKEVVP